MEIVMSKWSKEEKALSDSLFPHRILINLQFGNMQTFLSPDSEVIAWCFENFGETVKPPATMVNRFALMRAPELPHSANGSWMIKTQGRSSVKFFFKEQAHAVMFELRWREEFTHTQNRWRT